MSADSERQIIAAYQEQQTALRGAAQSTVEAAWNGLGSYNAADVQPFVDAIRPVVTAAQQHAASMTDGYIATLGAEVTGEPAQYAALDPVDYVNGAVRNGAPFDDVYRRSFVQVWSDLADGKQWADAILKGRNRAGQTASTDVALSSRAAARDAMAADRRIVGYRRVLTGFRSCRFCAVASTQRYHVKDLMPLHAHCDCAVAPLWGTHDPGRVINQDLLRDLKHGSERPDYWNRHGFVDEHGNPVTSPKKIRQANRDVTVKEHGELGPTLVSDKHHFTGPDQIKRTSAADSDVQDLSNRSAGSGSGGEPPVTPPSHRSGEPSEWKPSMSRTEAEHWVQGSVIQDDVTHITSPESARSIAEQGFDTNRSGGFGRTWGDGAYFATDTPTTDLYRRIQERFGPVSEIHAKVRLENPFQVQVPAGVFPTTTGQHLRDALEASRPDLARDFERRLDAATQHRNEIISEAWNRFPADRSAREQFMEQSGVVPGVAGEQSDAAEAFTSTLQDAGYDGVILTQPELTGPVGGNQAIAFDRESVVTISG